MNIIVKATELWAWARNTGQKTAHDEDVMLAAIGIIKAQKEGQTIIATTNKDIIQTQNIGKKGLANLVDKVFVILKTG